MVPTLLGVTIVVFVLTHIVPGDAATTLLGENPTEEQIAAMRQYLQLDRPAYLQYLTYLSNLIHGDLGTSAVDGRPVLYDFSLRFPATIELTAVAMVFAIGAGIPLGRLAARRPHGVVDTVTTAVSLAGVAVPLFVLGLAMQYVFSVTVGILPAAGRIDSRLAIPTVTSFMLVDTLLAGNALAFGDALRHLTCRRSRSVHCLWLISHA